MPVYLYPCKWPADLYGIVSFHTLTQIWLAASTTYKKKLQNSKKKANFSSSISLIIWYFVSFGLGRLWKAGNKLFHSIPTIVGRQLEAIVEFIHKSSNCPVKSPDNHVWTSLIYVEQQ